MRALDVFCIALQIRSTPSGSGTQVSLSWR
jgi:hypothetical protein